MLSSWLLESIAHEREEVKLIVNQAILVRELQQKEIDIDFSKIQKVIDVLELSLFDLISSNENKEKIKEVSIELFKLNQILPLSQNSIENLQQQLKYSCFAVLGDLGMSASKHLKENDWDKSLLESDNWKERTLATVIDVWLRLIRKRGWSDRDAVLENISNLRISQKEYEEGFLKNSTSKQDAYELIVLYHLASSAEKLAIYITDGKVNGNFQIQQILDSHFDRAIDACEEIQMLELEPLVRVLAITSKQLVENAIWTVTRAVNTRVTKFVKTLVDRGRGDKALFDVLPPQRHTLAEEGLLGSSRRAVVVSLPTSSGKTMIAQFRILQALNQFDTENGWVAYLAPTKALVNQITRRIRKDFESLDIVVEQVSPALEVDGFEMSLLSEADRASQFKVLITTPEKLDLMLRQGWEEKIGRPLTLVVVDEAHNIQDAHRGLKLELLLANINKECENAQFLLLTPFIQNAKEVATWLGGANSDDISMSIDWQPNDRAIGILYSQKSNSDCSRNCASHIKFKSVHTTKSTIAIPQDLMLLEEDKTFTFSQIDKDNSKLATVAVNQLKERDSVIVIHGQVRWVWSLAKQIKEKSQKVSDSEKINFVKNFLTYEFGEEFQLLSLLDYGIGVHHAGLSEETRTLMEWLFEEGEINVLVATTTIAQGMNFPIGAVVMASTKYFSSTKEPIDMPPEDFWNIAGRAGRVDQDSIGIVALTAGKASDIERLESFIHQQTGNLNSSLIHMVREAIEKYDIEDLGKIVYQEPTWSTFVQYLTHTYRQAGASTDFLSEIEQVLRGTFGFEKIREHNREWSRKFIKGIENYISYMQEPNQPIKLVDSTGFSLQSVKQLLAHAREEHINQDSWNENTLFSHTSNELERMVGILLKIPELRDNFETVINKIPTDNGHSIAHVIKDWVNGEDLPTIAQKYFRKENDTMDEALTKCCQNLYGKITQTASWGLSAMLSSTVGEIEDEEFKSLSNLPARVYYGVNNDNAMMLRLLGVPRSASIELSTQLTDIKDESVSTVRKRLKEGGANIWKESMGENKGKIYHRVWSILEGME